MTEKDIKESLIRQLQSRGADVAHFRSLIDDYCFMRSQIQKMKKSIRKDGYTYKAISAQGKEYEKENPAVKNIVLYSRQMLAILNQMELKTNDPGLEPDDDEL